MSTLQLENIKHVDASSNALELHSDGTVTISQVNGNVKADGFYHDGTLTDNIVFSQGTSTQSASISLWGNDHASYPGQVHIVGNSSNASADSGGIAFWEFTGSAFQKNATINKSGYFTASNQPAFRVGLSSNYTSVNNDPIYFNVGSGGEHYNIGSHYNAATGRFTAPVAGRYFFHTMIIWGPGLTNGEAMQDSFRFNVNGSKRTYSHRRGEYVDGTTGNGGYYTDFGTDIFNLQAGDYVFINSQRSLPVHGNSEYTIFTGYLLG